MPGFTEDFYVRYYVGHTGKFGHEFLEFEFKPDGQVGLLLRLSTLGSPKRSFL